MGSLYRLCSLSGLPIEPGAPCQYLLLTEHPVPEFGSHIYRHYRRWVARTFPIPCTYDDDSRGLVQFEPGPLSDLLVGGLQRELVPLAAEHGYPPSTPAMGLKELLEAMPRDRVLVPSHRAHHRNDPRPDPRKAAEVPRGQRGSCLVLPALIRHDVWEYFLDAPRPDAHFHKDLPENYLEFQDLVRAYWTQCRNRLANASQDPRWQNSFLSRLTPDAAEKTVGDWISCPRLQEEYPQGVARILTDEQVFGLGSHWLMALQMALTPTQVATVVGSATELLWVKQAAQFLSRGLEPSRIGGEGPDWGQYRRYHQFLAKTSQFAR